MNRNRHILFTDFDGFYIAVERSINPRLHNRPLAIGSQRAQRGVIAAVSPEARQYGVYPSMTTSAALSRCPELYVIDGDFALYRRAARGVRSYLRQFSPQFEWSTLDQAYIDVTGTQRLFGDVVDLGARIHREIHARYRLQLTIGVAINKLVAKIAARTARPAGLCDVAPGSECEFLAPLPIGSLPGVGPATQKRLGEFNIETVGDLAATKREFLLSAFGVRGQILYARARGIDYTPVGLSTTPSHITVDKTLTNDSNDRHLLRAVIFLLAEQAGQQLREHGRQTQKVALTLTFIDGHRADSAIRSDFATDLDDEIGDAAVHSLQRMNTGRQAVRRITLKLTDLIPANRQMSLLDDSRNYDRKRLLSSVIDAIRRRHGATAIQRGRTLVAA